MQEESIFFICDYRNDAAYPHKMSAEGALLFQTKVHICREKINTTVSLNNTCCSTLWCICIHKQQNYFLCCLHSIITKNQSSNVSDPSLFLPVINTNIIFTKPASVTSGLFWYIFCFFLRKKHYIRFL